jgi:hypothetical protein
METIIIQTEGSKLKLIKQLLKELNIAFETASKAGSPYDPDFVNKITRAKNEKSIPVKSSSLWVDIN